MTVVFQNDAYYNIEYILDKNWNRVLKKQTLSMLFELCRTWWNTIEDAINATSIGSGCTRIGGGRYLYQIPNDIGCIQFYPLLQDGIVVSVVIEAFNLKLPWRKGESIQVLSANDALKEIWAIKTHKIPMYENKQNQLYTTMNTTKKKNVVRLTESDLHNIIKRCVLENLRTLDGGKYKRHILTESQESKSISAAKKLLKQRAGWDEKESDEFIRKKLRGMFPSVHLKVENSFWV